MGTQSNWTDAEAERAKELWAVGQSAAEIAKVLHRTRESIIGKLHRLGLQRSAAASVNGQAVPGAVAPRPWSAQELTIIRALAAEDRSCGYIAMRIGRSKGAVYKKVEELGLQVAKRASPQSARKFGAPRSPAPAAPSAARCSPPTPPLVLVATSPRSLGRATLVDLAPSACRWPVSDPGAGNGERMLFCGEAAEPGVSYCAGHCREAFTAGANRKTGNDYARSLRRYA